MNDYNKANVNYERQLSLAKEIKDLQIESTALDGLGLSYGFMGEYRIAMEYLEMVLTIEIKQGDRVAHAKVYRGMGDILTHQDGSAKETVDLYQKSCDIFDYLR